MGPARVASLLAATPALLFASSAWARADAFVGTFDDPATGGVLTLRRAEAGYAGRFRLGELSAPLQARLQQGILRGAIRSLSGPEVPFAARALPGLPGRIEVWTPMGTARYRRRSAERSAPKSRAHAPSQGHRAPSAGGRAAGGGLAGLRLHVMTRGSVLSSAHSSAYTTLDLCPGGVFREATDSHFAVAGASGAAAGRAVGRWRVRDTAAGGVLRLEWADGDVAEHDLERIRAGRWRYGRTSFAAERGAARCPS